MSKMGFFRVIYLSLFLILIFSNHTFAITVTAVNAANTNSSSTPVTFYFPIAATGGANAACVGAKLYPDTLTALDGTSGYLYFNVTPSKTLSYIKTGTDGNTINTTSDKFSIRAELTSSTTGLDLYPDTSGTYTDANKDRINYGTTDSATIKFGISLADIAGSSTDGYCTNDGNANCQLTAGTSSSLTLNIGIVYYTDYIYGNTTKADYSSYVVSYTNCPAGAGATPTLNLALEPGDGRVKLTNNSDIPTFDVPAKSVALYADSRTSYPTVGAEVKTSYDGTPTTGTVYAFENLTNDTRYCFSLGFVNYAGFITNLPTTGSTFCATPTQVDGFLQRSTCFIATSAYGDVNHKHVKLFRDFRDQVLLKNYFGRIFVKWYYSWSEHGAEWLDQHSYLKPVVRAGFYPIYLFSEFVLWLLHHIWIALLVGIAGLIIFRSKLKFLISLVIVFVLILPNHSKAATEYKTNDPAFKDAQHMQPYIESLKAGHELKPKFSKKARNGAGISVMTGNTFSVSSSKNQANCFDCVYHTADKYNLSLKLFYEKQFLRDQGFGSLGPLLTGQMIVVKGKGVFTKNGTTSDDTIMQMTIAPLFAGASYRFIAMRWVVPFVQASYGIVPMYEQRSDNKNPRKAMSTAHNFTLGVAINLDWLHRAAAWNQYMDNEVLHTYLTFERVNVRTHTGTIGFSYDATLAGLTFEF